jgi:hypothetical protein
MYGFAMYGLHLQPFFNEGLGSFDIPSVGFFLNFDRILPIVVQKSSHRLTYQNCNYGVSV